MTKRNRLVQHKSQREDVSPLKENRTLKQENKSLKRQLSKMRKQMGKMIDSHMTIKQMVDEEPPETMAGESPQLAGGCEACSSTNLASIQMPTGTLTVCKACGHRKKEAK